MAAAGVILVLAWVPDIEIKKFQPLEFNFNEGGELSVWGILAVVLVYYAIRFGVEFWTDYMGWIDTYRQSLTITLRNHSQDYAHARHTRRLYWKFLILDVVPPALMFLAALGAMFQMISPLVWPPLP